MAGGMKLLALAALPALVAASVSSGGLLEAFNDLPPCGVTCFTSSISQSSCSPLDFECMCTDQAFLDVAQGCILDSCSTLQSLEITRSVSEACGVPRRNSKSKLLLPLIAEVPAAICPWLRLYTNWKLQSRIALDDYLMTAAGILYAVFLVLGAYIGQYAFGEDIWYVEPDTVVQGLKLFYIDQPFYLVCLCLTKVSVLCFYLRIFTTTKFRWAAYATMALVILPTIIILFLQIFQCFPVHLIWEGWLTKEWEKNCLDLNLLAYVASSFSIAQEFILLLLPMPWLVQLRIGLRTKLGVMIMFSLGIFVLATSCARLSYILAFGFTQNPTWDYVDPVIWSGLEVAVSVIVACLPALRVLILHYIPSIRTTANSGSKATGQGNGYGKLGFSSRSTASRARGTGNGTMQSSTGVGIGNESQVELGMNEFGNSYEENGYRSKTPTEVKVAAVDNTFELVTRPIPSRGILVENELVVETEYNDRGPSPQAR